MYLQHLSGIYYFAYVQRHPSLSFWELLPPYRYCDASHSSNLLLQNLSRRVSSFQSQIFQPIAFAYLFGKVPLIVTAAPLAFASRPGEMNLSTTA